jgi:hypothetical protein
MSRSVLLVSLPGIYPSFPAVGLEMVAQGLRGRGHTAAVINGHLDAIRFLDGDLLLRLCQQNIWDLLYASLVYHKARVGLASKAVLRMLTAQDESYGLSEDELLRATSAVLRFNRHLMGRLRSSPPPALVGFNVQNNQLLVAKYFAREVKRLWGDQVLTAAGGASVRDGLGASIIEHHADFDFAVEANAIGAIEHMLDPQRACVHGLYSKSGCGRAAEDSIWDTPMVESDLTYEEFYRERKQYEGGSDFSMFHPWDGIPAILAAGCRWGKCRFCNLRQPHRQFSVESVCAAIEQRRRATGISKVFLIDLCQPASGVLDRFLSQIENRSGAYCFGAMFRADIAKSDLVRFKRNGLDICHLGIEAYSDGLLVKMNKGVRLIDIAKVLITCVEEGVRCEGNLLLNLPWETEEDIEETGRNLAILSHLPLPRLVSYKLSHGSIEYRAAPDGQREDWALEMEVRYAYPAHLRDSVQTMYYSRRRPRLMHERRWLDVIKQYRRYRASRPQLLYEVFEDGLVIHDTRDVASAARLFLNGPSTAPIYEYCKDVRTVSEIERQFPGVPAARIRELLEMFVSTKTMLTSSDGRFLAIAMRRP